ncbi:MAG TPA: M15 family metallopeptidase, partial [Aggregicoccus sp.]|nr:M15 family metallopeptidase [Aggregicoccus sp.]
MTRPSFSQRLLVGQDEDVMVAVPGGAARVHREVLPALVALRDAAAKEGFALEVGSGFRSFERQLLIWNAKARGERPVLDAQEQPLSLAALTPLERVHAILRWSALPGASRHHWGTDVDVFDRAALAPGATFEMRAEESAPGGPFAPMHTWLDANLHRFGFFRPYAEERGGVSPERWHLSYAPLSIPLQQEHSVACCERALRAAQVEL